MVASTLNNLGSLFSATGEPELALAYHERALRLRERTLGVDHPKVALVSATDVSAFALFMATLPYRFYAILALVMVFAIAISDRDFGPMRYADGADDGGLRGNQCGDVTGPCPERLAHTDLGTARGDGHEHGDDAVVVW